MNKWLLALMAGATAALLLSSCHRAAEPAQPQSLSDTTATSLPPGDSLSAGIYYWKTVFRLTEWDRNWMREHGIGRLYLRLFDVDMDRDCTEPMPVPIATTRFAGTVPEGIEVVPVVYITVSALREGGLCNYDTLCYKRIMAMTKRNGLGPVREIQLDCDWTATTQDDYFRFCSRMRGLAARDSIRLSVTVRLHQLRTDVPPADRAVLMLYNTGSLYSTQTTNSILSASDAAPWLSRKISYPLPLSFAYPAYGWGILLRNGQFAAILHHTDFSDPARYRCDSACHYTVTRSHWLEQKQLVPGDVIRLEIAGMDETARVKAMAVASLGRPAGNIVYHLDSLGLSEYTKADINALYE